MTRFIRCAATALLPLFLHATPARALDTPAAPVAAIYLLETKGTNVVSIDGKKVWPKVFTHAFQDVLASIAKREDGTGEAVLDFDPVLSMNGDGDAADLAIKVVTLQGETADVMATFGRGKERRAVSYAMRLEDGAWRIDDIKGVRDARNHDAWSVRKISEQDWADRAKPTK